jgi:hypothetical protein
MSAGQTVADYQRTLQLTLKQNSTLRDQVRTLETRNRSARATFNQKTSWSAMAIFVVVGAAIGAALTFLVLRRR